MSKASPTGEEEKSMANMGGTGGVNEISSDDKPANRNDGKKGSQKSFLPLSMSHFRAV